MKTSCTVGIYHKPHPGKQTHTNEEKKRQIGLKEKQQKNINDLK